METLCWPHRHIFFSHACRSIALECSSQQNKRMCGSQTMLTQPPVFTDSYILHVITFQINNFSLVFAGVLCVRRSGDAMRWQWQWQWLERRRAVSYAYLYIINVQSARWQNGMLKGLVKHRYLTLCLARCNISGDMDTENWVVGVWDILIRCGANRCVDIV